MHENCSTQIIALLALPTPVWELVSPIPELVDESLRGRLAAI